MGGNMEETLEIRKVKNGFYVTVLCDSRESSDYVFESFWSMSLFLETYYRGGDNGKSC